MENDMSDVISSINVNQVLIAILEQYRELRVPSMKFMDTNTTNKELVIEYDKDGPAFTFKVRNMDAQKDDTQNA